MSALLGAALVLACLVGVYMIMFRGSGGGAGGGFSLGRALMPMRSPHGQNATLVLAVVAVAQAMLQLANDFPNLGEPAAGVIAIGAIAVVAGLAIFPRTMTTVVTLGAIAISLVSIAQVHGLAYVVILIAIVLPLLWLLGLVRGFVRFGP